MYFETKDLSVGYHGNILIQDINLSVEKGKIMTLIGPNGSGKSTILKTITKHLEEIGGVVTIDSENILKCSNKELAKKLSVMLTDRINPDLMTCKEVVSMGRYPYTNHFGKITSEDERVVQESLKMVKGLELADKPFTDISDGQRQRILLARAICQEPSIIVLDEPTSFLDIRHKVELLDILRRMATEKDVAVIMSLHEIDLAAKISDTVICIKGDCIRVAGNPEEIFSDEMVQSLYGLEKGSYNSMFGSIELHRTSGKPRVFILGGMGKGIRAYRVLQKHRIPFATGILFSNDVDCQVAKFLSSDMVLTKAFCPVEQVALQRAKEIINGCPCVLDVGVEVGEYNQFQDELRDYALKLGKPVFQTISEVIKTQYRGNHEEKNNVSI
ncbi:ABC transporter ATP-binding protein [Guggenheimella bovis]